jgi:hypothetical protein
MLSAVNTDREQQDVGEAPAEGAAAVVSKERFCITCGYQLSGLPIDGVCPECSTRVELSLIQLSLLTDPIEHVRTLRRGARRLMLGTVVFLGSPLLFGPFAVGFAGTGLNVGLAAMFLAVQFILASVIFWGVRDYTQENPDPAVAKLLESARIAALLPSAILFGLSLLGTSLLLLLVASSGDDAFGAAVASYACGVLVWLFQVPGVVSYTGKLAGRVPDLRLVKRAEMFKLPILGLLLLGTITWGVASLLGVILYLFVVERMHWQLKRIIKFRASRGS